MASNAEILPEGTDTVIGGASDAGTAEQIEDAASSFAGATSRIREEAAGLKDKATAKARDYAEQGKDRATDALDGLSRAVSEVAATVDERVGAEYGDYARRAAEAVATLSTNLRSKDLDELYEDAQKMVRSSPAIAIGTAAAVGFALVRLMKSGAEASSTPAAGTKPAGGSRAGKSPAKKPAKPAS